MSTFIDGLILSEDSCGNDVLVQGVHWCHTANTMTECLGIACIWQHHVLYLIYVQAAAI